MNRAYQYFAALLMFAASAAAAHATVDDPFMRTSGITSPPIGHYEFCEQNRAECHHRSGSTAPMVLTPETWRTLLAVNYQVNSQIQPETDMQAYGVQEYWTYPTTVGDCEDYALLKQRQLVADGFPASDVLMTVVLQPNGEGHAVLTVHTDRGDFVLDNMRDKVLLWSETDYTFIKRQSSLNSARWDKIRDGRPALVGSVR